MERIPLRNDYTRLPPEFKAEWVAALRSGKYPQTTGMLRTETGYCCLGVRCEISNVEWKRDYIDGTFSTENGGEGVPNPADIGEDIWAILMQVVFPCHIEYNCDGTFMSCLTTMNDVDELTFPQIADWIEKYL